MREKTLEMKQTFRILAALVLLCLQPGCVTVRGRPEPGGASVSVRELAKSARSWDGTLLPFYPQGQPEITIRRITISPGSRLETHGHPVINAGVLLRGQLEVVTTGGKKLHLKAGDPIVELVNTPHYGVNRGEVPAEIVVFYAGTVGAPITVAERP